MPKRDKLSPREIEREYGFAYSFFKSDPELWDLLQKAIKETWDPNKFATHFKATKWYRKHSDSWRQVTALKHSDPATYRERLGNMRTQVQNLAGRYSVDLTNKELAARLFVAEKTVKTHVSAVLSKLHLSDRTQAALFAVRHGLVES